MPESGMFLAIYSGGKVQFCPDVSGGLKQSAGKAIKTLITEVAYGCQQRGPAPYRYFDN